MGRDYSLVVKNVEFHVLPFFKHDILAIAGVSGVLAKAVKSCRCRKCTSATDKKLKNRILYGLAVLLCTIIRFLSVLIS